MYRFKNIITATLVLALFSTAAVAEIIEVRGAYDSIQEAIDNSTDGDTILVEPYNYMENVNFNGHNVVVASHFLFSENTEDIYNTRIDGDLMGSVVTFENGETQAAQLIGFSLINGEADAGGAIYILNSSPVIRDCKFENNNAIEGGGIYIEGGEAEIDHCVFSTNTGDDGGAIYIDNATVVIENVTFWNNVSDGSGGAIYVESSDVTIENSVLWENEPEQIAYAPDGEPSTVSVSGSDIMDGEEGINTNNNGSLDYADDNIAEDPQFENPDGGDLDPNPEGPAAGRGADAPREEPTVDEMINTLIEAVEDLDLNRRWNHFLCRPVRFALWFHERDRDRLAATSLVVFNRRVALANRRNRITDAEAGYLTGTTTTTIEMLVNGVDGMEDFELMDDAQLPGDYYLSQNFPNPFNSTTKIEYGVPVESDVKIAVYDLSGRMVQTLVNGSQSAGTHLVTWNAHTAPAGVYLVKMDSDVYSDVRQVTLTK